MLRGATNGIAGRSFRVLIVDDDDQTREIFGDFLRANGWHIAEASGGDEALAVVASLSPDVIVMDVAMKGLDGIEATRLLKGGPSSSNIPVVILTAHPAYEAAAVRAGCAAFVTKPCSPRNLLDVLRRSIARAWRSMRG